jgi:hypothetical protein
MLISAICFFVFSVALVLYADLLWTRWLSYCPAPVALGVVGVLLWETLGNETRACRGGLQRCPGAQCASPRTHHRGRLAGRRRRQEEDSQGWGVTHQPGIGTTRHELVLLDRKDEELLNVDDPLEPPDRYQRFLESIPRWTGLQVQETLDTK